MDAVTFASWIIIGAAIGKLVFGWWDRRQKEIERLAVVHEYEDERTSEVRKQLLMVRYPEYVVPEPSYRFRELAWKDYKFSRQIARSAGAGTIHYIGAILILALAGAAIFFSYVVYLNSTNPPPYGSATQEAWELLVALILSHFMQWILLSLCAVVLTANVVKFMFSQRRGSTASGPETRQAVGGKRK